MIPHPAVKLSPSRTPGTRPAYGLALVVGLLLLPCPVRAQGAVEGLFITVKSQITSDEATRVKEAALRLVERVRNADKGLPLRERRAIKIVFDFNPKDGPSRTTSFGPCYELAREILNLTDATTVAFVHNEVTQHSVLPVLACKEIVMSSDARLGPVIGDKDRPASPTEVQGYEEILQGRTLNPALIMKMLEPETEVLEGRTGRGNPYYIRGRDREKEKQNGIVVTVPDPVIGRGPGSYTASQAQKFGLCKLVLDSGSRQEVARAYQMPASSLRDPLLGQEPIPVRFEVTGSVNAALKSSLERRIRQAISSKGRHANLIVLQLDCGAGDPTVAQDIAAFLRNLKDDDGKMEVMTVAYVPKRAPDTAAIIALGCTEIVLSKEAEFGDFTNFLPPAGEPLDKVAHVSAVLELAKAQGYEPLVFRAMFDPNLTLYRVVSRGGAREWGVKTEEELKRDAAEPQPRWEERGRIKKGGQDGKPLILKAEEAKELGIARHLVEDLDGVYAAYGIKPENVPTVGNDWFDALAQFLRHPAMAVFLVMVGITCLILELKIPGASLPGVVAAVCFVLFFWAHMQTGGDFWLLAVLLFALGLILLLIEIFVLPGFGVVGISGAILLVLSLGLVTLEKKPETSQEWFQFGSTLTTFALALVGSLIGSLILAWNLHHIPIINRLILKPAGEGEGSFSESASGGTAVPDYSALLGAIGVSTTPLRPAGKVQIGDEFVDVVAECYVSEGTKVQVIEIEGNRVVVKEV